MINYISKYFISFLIVGIISILTIDFIVLPSITQKKNEVFLPDVRLADIEEAKEILKDFNLSVFYVDNNKNYKEGHVIETSQEVFQKLRKVEMLKLLFLLQKKTLLWVTILINHIEVSNYNLIEIILLLIQQFMNITNQ